MIMKILAVLCAALSVVPSEAATLVFCDSTAAEVSIIDTGRGSISVLRDRYVLRIDKINISRIIPDTTPVPGLQGAGALPTLTTGSALKKTISGYAVKKTPMASRSAIAFLKRPLLGNNDPKAAAAFTNRLLPFLSATIGPVRELSKEGMYFFLSGDGNAVLGCRYAAVISEMTVRSNERHVGLRGVVKLDTAGNFVPSKTETALHAHESETIVRIMVLDRTERTIVFDERIAEVDKGLFDLDAEKPNDTQIRAENNSILSVERKLEARLKKQIR